MDQGIKSRPRYEPLLLDPAGRRHLVVMDHASLPQGAFAAAPAGAEIWPVPPGGAADLLGALATRLAQEAMGLRLYVVGPEAFIWDVAALAFQAGMGWDEVFLCQAGSLRRRVYCTHCKTLNEAVTTSITLCAGCGVSLFVRDHFSPRIGAYMGVQADAEQRGDVPAPETLYP